MDEEFYENYCQWANDELIWGGGKLNWCRAYSLEEWEKQREHKYEWLPDIEIPF